MEKRYQVFVSSTYLDLQEERREVIQALLELDCIPASMELFPASDKDQWSYIQKVIDDCDYYIVIIGGRYGSTTPEGLSYTEKEYDYAVSKNIPAIGFIHDEPGELPAKHVDLDSEQRKKLDAFKEKVKSRLCKSWRGASDLGGAVSRSLVRMTKERPREGWVKARHASDPEALIKLREQLIELESQLQKSKSNPWADIENLASGDGQISFEIKYEVVLPKPHDFYVGPTEYKKSKVMVTVTWNEILAEVGPLLFDEASAASLKNAFERFLVKAAGSKISERAISKTFETSDFHTVLAQFRALGILDKSQKKHPPSDRGTYWTLTPNGEKLVMQLKAIKKTN